MKQKIAYWVLTGLFSLMMVMSASGYLTASPQMVEGFHHLGYPDYFRVYLGVAKLVGVLALVVPWTPRTVREWAYAGFAITTVSAAVSHGMSGDPAGIVVAPVVALGVLLGSHQLWRRLRDEAPRPVAQPAVA
ncbi:DoxX family protein [Corallococcus sp. H22C18031201]|uniref:DoxX family protein n=1 Tax=Citreicoccus inhibens TaxID=2849499 RepID=UPI000E75143C|nr:DoxX family protein [Citreicoccus inhibens]MBU8897996.1 DoxX family protein [Citreicoccus inhibens]RJS15804.1 DoxX family protein [Corallococcus sp. H22C18031201]